ncbi:MAG: hypothetical protein ACLT2F_01920 [Butyricicoccus sp.]
MRDGFDCSELMDFAERLGAQPKEMLKAQKKMLRTSGKSCAGKRLSVPGLMCAVQPSIVQSMTVRQATITEASSGKLNKEDDTLRIRVYSSDEIGHLIEDGWTPKLRDGSKGSYQAGKKVFAKAAEEFEPEFESAAEDMVDELIDKI